MTDNITDLATRRKFRIDQHNDEPTREQKAQQFIELCADAIFVNALKISAMGGPELSADILKAVLADMEKRKV